MSPSVTIDLSNASVLKHCSSESEIAVPIPVDTGEYTLGCVCELFLLPPSSCPSMSSLICDAGSVAAVHAAQPLGGSTKHTRYADFKCGS